MSNTGIPESGILWFFTTMNTRPQTYKQQNKTTNHYLEKSFDFYPCDCATSKRMSNQTTKKCSKCLMSHSSRITHMKTKI